MQYPLTNSTVNENICSVKTVQLPLIPAADTPMIHHKVRGANYIIIRRYSSVDRYKTYGVSSSQKILSPGLFRKRFDCVRDCLDNCIGLTLSQREVTLRLLWFHAYYGKVYPKEATITAQPGCKKATFWRTIRRLEDTGMIVRVRRYIIRHHAQISNLYLLNKLLIVIARYLAEHGTRFSEKWLQPMLIMPGSQFWPAIFHPSGVSPPISFPLPSWQTV